MTWTTFGAECLQAVCDLRWMIVFAVLLIATDFWWGVRELAMMHQQAETKREKEKTKFHFSRAGRRTLNKLVDYTTYLLLGCVAGLAITEPMGLCDHTLTAAIGLGFGCLFEVSSIVGHIAVVKGINIRLNLKRLLVALVKQKNEAMAEVLDEGIEDINDNRRHHRHRGDCTISATYGDDIPDHDNGDIFPSRPKEESDETEVEENC